MVGCQMPAFLLRQHHAPGPEHLARRTIAGQLDHGYPGYVVGVFFRQALEDQAILGLLELDDLPCGQDGGLFDRRSQPANDQLCPWPG